MAIKIDAEIIRQINELYYELHNKAEVARRIGCSPATVTRYIDAKFTPFKSENETRFDYSLLKKDYGINQFKGLDSYGILCLLTNDERKEIEELWKEIH